MNIKEQLDFLGYPVRDKVTGLEGVATSVSFDLYGCVQVVINPGIDKEGKQREQTWFDSNRLIKTSELRVMEPPNFDLPRLPPDHGPAEKPAARG